MRQRRNEGTEREPKPVLGWRGQPVRDPGIGMPEVEILSLRRHQIHRRGDFGDYDPVSAPEPGLVSRETPIATIGSCFALGLRRWLRENEHNCIEPDPGPETSEAGIELGSVFNTASARQLVERAFGAFRPAEDCWAVDGKWIDPYGMGLSRTSEAALRREVETYLAGVRELIEGAAVLICTVGLAEVWRRRDGGGTFFQVPPRAVYRADEHEFVLTTTEENAENLARFYAACKRVNPGLRLMITLSPVPLRATFRDMPCMLADEVSKSTLRVAIDRFCRQHPEVYYFPAYEIVKRIVRDAWEPDGMHVKRETFERVMATFQRCYGTRPVGAVPSM